MFSLIGASIGGVVLGGLGALPVSASTERAAERGAAFRLRADPPGSGDRVHVGNGHHNRSALSLRSPTTNRGFQHTVTNTADGPTIVRNALCRNTRNCTINQQIIFVVPTPPAIPMPTPTPSPTPEPVEAATRDVPAARPLLSLTIGGLNLLG